VNPRALLHLLANGAKAIEVVTVARDFGLLGRLDAGWVTLGALAAEQGLIAGRTYKLMDCLESLGFVERQDGGDAIEDTRYRSREPLAALVDAALATERDRDRHPWRDLEGRLAEVLRGGAGLAPERFTWPPATDAQLADFEASMAAGAGPIAEAFLGLGPVIAGDGRPQRILDVGGGDGTLALRLLEAHPHLSIDVFNLPAAEPLVRRHEQPRLGFVGGDFLGGELPEGYDALWFVRVLHDWPADVARALLAKARRALPPGGRIVISEEIRNAERLAVQFFWSHFLIGLDSCVSRLRDLAFYEEALGRLGFRQIAVYPGPFDVMVATA
jgi:demethylspheroidene O-methyltransferase